MTTATFKRNAGAEIVQSITNETAMADPVGTFRVVVPTAIKFANEAFIVDPSLLGIANALRNRHDMPTEVTLACLWKRQGGSSEGKPCWSKITLTHNGLLGFYAPVDVAIWLAADHLAQFDPDETQRLIEAILFANVCRIDVDDKLKPVIKPHDFTGMRAELEHYGLWSPDFMRAAKSFEQAKLFG